MRQRSHGLREALEIRVGFGRETRQDGSVGRIDDIGRQQDPLADPVDRARDHGRDAAVAQRDLACGLGIQRSLFGQAHQSECAADAALTHCRDRRRVRQIAVEERLDSAVELRIAGVVREAGQQHGARGGGLTRIG